MNWFPLLQNDYHKQIIIEALHYRVVKKRLNIYAFVVMLNHLHFIWQLPDGIIREEFQRDFLKFTPRSILNFMRMNDDSLVTGLKVKAPDRKFQVWERNSLSIDIYMEKVRLQKINYIHANPVHPKWKLADLPENYQYSSAQFYETGVDEFNILTHFRE